MVNVKIARMFPNQNVKRLTTMKYVVSVIYASLKLHVKDLAILMKLCEQNNAF